MSTNKGNIFPLQKLPLSKKNENWRRKSVDALIGRHKRGDVRHTRMKRSYDIMNSIFDLEDLKYVLDPYNVKEGFPARIQNINLIRPKIEGLKGEQIKRPSSFHVFRTDERAVASVIDKEKELLFQAFQASLLMTNDVEAQEYLQNRLNEIQNYIRSKYYSPAEQTANASLKYLNEKLDLNLNSLKTWEDALVAGEAINYVGILNGDPLAERVNPLTFSYDRDPELRFIEDGEWAVREMLMTPSDIWDRFSDIMKESDFNYLLDRISNDVPGSQYSNAATGSNINTNYIDYYNSGNINSLDWVEDNRKGPFVSVYHCVWKSFKKVGYLTFLDEDGDIQTTIVDETYKLGSDETIEWDWIVEIWEGYRFWQDVYSEIRPVEYQYTSLEDPNARKLPYVGAAFSINNTEGKSLVEIMKPLQYFYLTLFYRLELAIARDAGKPIVMDITQIPKSMGIEPDKWMHYLKALGVVWVNPYETSFDIPGREGGKPSAMNQITSVDMTQTHVISEYIGLMVKVEQMIEEISGITPERQGQAAPRQLVGNLRQNITQSSHTTEPLFYMHDMVIRNTLTMLLNVAKFAWRKSNRKYINYVLSGPERLFIQIDDDFLYSDYDVFLTNSSKEVDNLELIRTLYQPAMQNGASLLDVASMMTSENISELKIKLEEIEQKRAEMIQQQSQVEQAAIQEQNALKQEELRIKEEDSIRKADTDLQVAMIKESNNSEDTKLSLQGEKIDKDYELKKRQLDETERHNKAQESISKISKKTNNK